MVIDLTGIINSVGLKKDFSGSLSLNEFEFSGEAYSFTQPLQVSGCIMNTGDTYELVALVSGYINLNCYRCTVDITKSFEFSINEKLTNSDDSEQNEDVVKFEGNILDIEDIIINNIFVNLSMKYLCSDECRGLCPICGVDLNKEECRCTNEKIDPRFEALKKLLNK